MAGKKRPNRLEVPLTDNRNEKLEETIIGRDADGNLRRDKTDAIREMIDKEAQHQRDIQLVEFAARMFGEDRTNYRFDIEEELRKRGLSSEDYVFDVEKLIEKMRGRDK